MRTTVRIAAAALALAGCATGPATSPASAPTTPPPVAAAAPVSPPPSASAPRPTPVATAPAGAVNGYGNRFPYHALRLSEVRACNPNPDVSLVAAGSGFELYSARCTRGDALAVRCERGACWVVK